jgi:BioD-like phosphotransacetylase family protein
MKSLYVTSVEPYSGKTATCLALGKRFQAEGYNVGYFKPLSLNPWRTAGGVADEDAAFVKEVLGLTADPWDLSPVVVTADFLRERLRSGEEIDLMDTVQAACERIACAERDVLLLEGGGSLREGYVVGLPTPKVASNFGSAALALVKYASEVRVLDDALTALTRLDDLLCGVILNRVPQDAMPFVMDTAVPYLEWQGIAVLGVLPEVRSLKALTVAELVDVLEAKVLTTHYNPQALVETFTVGAMTAEAALRVFRKQTNKTVITGGDRTDIQLAALETSTTCLVLTGNLQPSPLIVKQADEFGVAVLLVHPNTITTVEAIERVFGKTRLGQTDKLAHFEALLAEHVNLDRLYDALGLVRKAT